MRFAMLTALVLGAVSPAFGVAIPRDASAVDRRSSRFDERGLAKDFEFYFSDIDAQGHAATQTSSHPAPKFTALFPIINAGRGFTTPFDHGPALRPGEQPWVRPNLNIPLAAPKPLKEPVDPVGGTNMDPVHVLR